MTNRRARWPVALAAGLVTGAAVLGVGVTGSATSARQDDPPPSTVSRGADVEAASHARAGLDQPGPSAPVVPRAEPGPAGSDPAPFDDTRPTVARLDPALLAALRRAATDAARDGVTVVVTSGWRSARHQEQLLREAVSTYGSHKEAARWVATPTTSAHVSGNAADVGQSDAVSWLSEHGAGYGLCQIYRNEPWHFELRPGAVDQGCPATYADPTQDPRMQR